MKTDKMQEYDNAYCGGRNCGRGCMELRACNPNWRCAGWFYYKERVEAGEIKLGGDKDK